MKRTILQGGERVTRRARVPLRAALGLPPALRLALVALGLTAAMLAGCAKEEKLSVANLPPETYLAIADSVRNTTSYIQTLTWWGDDKDGEVVAFEYRWFTDPVEKGCAFDTTWVRTEETSKTFELPVSEGQSVHRFEVRAVDNQGAVDPTPCRLTLPVRNTRPEVMIWHAASLPDTTFPAFLASWHGSDADGDSTIAKYVVWLDGSRDKAKVLTPPDTTVSLALEDFGGRYETQRTLSVIAIDSGCDTSQAATRTWYVKEPQGRILLVDDLGSEAGAAESATDTFYRAGLDECGRAYSVLDLGRFHGLVAAHNFQKLFSIFDLVIWYNDVDRSASANLVTAEKDLMAYLQDGGKVMLASMAAIGSGGALRDSLWPEVFGADSLYLRNGSTNFDCKNWALRGNAAVGLDSLKVGGIWSGVECMLPSSTATPLYYIVPGTVNSQQTENYYLALLNTWHTGETALITFPLSRSDRYGNALTEYCKIIGLLLQ